MQISGNIAGAREAFYGTVSWENDRITSVTSLAECKADADWIVPGFIESHLHGLGNGNAEHGRAGLHEMISVAPSTGITTMFPALASDTPENMLEFVRIVREMTSAPVAENCCRVGGSHLEGPYLANEYAGGMNPAVLRMPDAGEVKLWLKEAQGTLKLVTLAPELPGAAEVIKLLVQAGVTVSAGHCGMSVEQLPQAVDAGLSRMCHLFDAYAGRMVVSGVSMPALTDEVIVNDKLMIELILDTFHVPPTLVKLAIRGAGADRIIGITDALQGTGLPDAIYSDCGRDYRLTNGGVCRLVDEPDIIVGSCLMMNRAFYNLVTVFGCTPVEAAKITASNTARSLNIAHDTGTLEAGLRADITVLKSDMLTVKQTICSGVEQFAI